MLRMPIRSAPKIEADRARPAAPHAPDGPEVAASKRTGGLVLARQVDQSIMIGDEIAIEVVEVRASSARLRIVAPRSIPVHRREVFDAIRTAPKAEPDRPEAGPNRGGGLVLTRHAEQSIMIGDEIEVEVVGMKGGTVRLRILAPREVSVHRLEIYDAIRA